MVIVVTQQDIEKGIRKNRNYCPIALAIKSRIEQHRKRLNPNDVMVGCAFVLLSESKSALLPRKARLFIMDFDSGKIVQPFNFDLKVEL